MQLTITPNFAQERALNMLRRDWKANDTFMVYSPTGSGKTGLAAFIVAGFVSRGMRVLFCVPYTILIGQTANRFVQYGLPGDEIGYIWADHPNYDPDRKIQIASADTLIRRVFPENIDLLIIDDLGTEMTTQFTQSVLYRVLNDRLLENRSTIVSTNLGDALLRQRYTPAIVSRLLGAFEACVFLGRDIRQLRH